MKKKQKWITLIILKFIYKQVINIDKLYIPVMVLSVLIIASTPFINIIVPKLIIDELFGDGKIDKLTVFIGIIVGGNLLLNIINTRLSYYIKRKSNKIFNSFKINIGKKTTQLDFEQIENPVILEMIQKANSGIEWSGGLQQLSNSIIKLFSNTITLFGILYVISTLNILLILLIIFVVVFNSYMQSGIKKVEIKHWQNIMKADRMFQHHASVVTDYKYGKDIRLYNAKKLFINKLDSYADFVDKIFSIRVSNMKKYTILSYGMEAIQQILLYGYLSFQVIKGVISIGSFTMFISSANKFSESMTVIMNSYLDVQQCCRFMEEYMNLCNLKPLLRKNNKSLKANTSNFKFEFKNVSFKYPNNNNYVLKNISINIEKGQKLAIVGMNGAGKTTFIKLLTRLYDPTEGEILLNGTNIIEYDYNDYMNFISVVFQDYAIFPFTIAENIVFNKNTKEKEREIYDLLDKFSLSNYVKTLKNGIDTTLSKILDSDGTEFSKGQMQKLAISRALYKNTQIVVLDEPTASIDPISEYEIYTQFDKLVDGKTAIYISHRMSSCRFCDVIAVFDKGEIVQYGNHETLIKQTENKYAELFNTQALNYRI